MIISRSVYLQIRERERAEKNEELKGTDLWQKQNQRRHMQQVNRIGGPASTSSAVSAAAATATIVTKKPDDDSSDFESDSEAEPETGERAATTGARFPAELNRVVPTTGGRVPAETTQLMELLQININKCTNVLTRVQQQQKALIATRAPLAVDEQKGWDRFYSLAWL